MAPAEGSAAEWVGMPVCVAEAGLSPWDRVLSPPLALHVGGGGMLVRANGAELATEGGGPEAAGAPSGAVEAGVVALWRSSSKRMTGSLATLGGRSLAFPPGGGPAVPEASGAGALKREAGATVGSWGPSELEAPLWVASCPWAPVEAAVVMAALEMAGAVEAEERA